MQRLIIKDTLMQIFVFDIYNFFSVLLQTH